MRLALALVVVLGASAAAAPKGKGPKKAAPPPADRTIVVDDGAQIGLAPQPVTNHKEGEYEGVTPGEAPPHANGKRRAATAKNTLNWIGFEAKDNGAVVFLQAAQPFEVTQHVEGATLVANVNLPRMGANDWRNIDTRFFENPLSGIVAKMARGKKSGIEVRFAFKTASDAKEAAMRTNTEADGQYYVYLTFPPGAVTGKPDVEK